MRCVRVAMYAKHVVNLCIYSACLVLKGGGHGPPMPTPPPDPPLEGMRGESGVTEYAVSFLYAHVYDIKWLTSAQLPFLHRLALQQLPGASLACRSSPCLLFVLQHFLAHWLSDRSGQEALCNVICGKKHVKDGTIIYIPNIFHITVATNILVSDLFLLPWFIFLPNDCHS